MTQRFDLARRDAGQRRALCILRPAAAALAVVAGIWLAWSGPGAGAGGKTGPPLLPGQCALQGPGGSIKDLGALVGTFFQYTAPPGVDAVTGAVVRQANPNFYLDMQNDSTSAVTDPTITISSGYTPSVFDGSLPTSTLPSSCSLPTLPTGDGMDLPWSFLTAYGVQDPYTLGYDSSRTVTPDWVPVGGGDVRVQFAVTPTDPRFADGAAITVDLPEVSSYPGSAVRLVSLTAPSNLDQGETVTLSTTGWNLQGALLTKTYVFTATLWVAGPSDVASTGDAFITVFSNVATTPTGCLGACRPAGCLGACPTAGPSVTIPIPLLDGPVPGSGAITFSVAETDHTWTVGQQLSDGVNYGTLPQVSCTPGRIVGLPPGLGSGVTGAVRGNVTVGAGGSYYLDGGTVQGNVTVDRGATFVATGGSVDGNLTVATGASVVADEALVRGNVTSSGAAVSMAASTLDGNLTVARGELLADGNSIGGNLTATGAGWLALCGGSVGGNLTLSGTTVAPPAALSSSTPPSNFVCSASVAGNLDITGSTAAAPFEVGGGADCGNGLRVGGNLVVTANAAPVTVGGAPSSTNATRSDVVRGNITVTANTGGGTLTADDAGGNISLSGNHPGIVGSGNVAGGLDTGNRTA